LAVAYIVFPSLIVLHPRYKLNYFHAAGWEASWIVMFFGLCNSPVTFQNMMNNIFLIETDEGWILIYIDDILIFSKEKKDLQRLTL